MHGCLNYLGRRNTFDGGGWANLQEVVDKLDFPCYELKVEPDYNSVFAEHCSLEQKCRSS